MPPTFHFNRRIEPGQHCLADLFPAIASCAVLADLFPGIGELGGILANVKVFIEAKSHKIFVDNEDGSITIGQEHLNDVEDEILYLDLIHELCHVKQHLQGRDLYDRSRAYVDRETEIEAYLITVQEARRIGWPDETIFSYLLVPWITPEEHLRLARRLGIRIPIGA
ncbi:MAG: hypothetical protein M0009_11235 [Deltaproteobacteria bacterium]|nr:hypothetical protein [Deltaproteobacteria bacterium]